MLQILCKTAAAIFNFKIQIPVDTKSKFNNSIPLNSANCFFPCFFGLCGTRA